MLFYFDKKGAPLLTFPEVENTRVGCVISDLHESFFRFYFFGLIHFAVHGLSGQRGKRTQ